MAISRIKLPRVPKKGGVVPLCTVSSGTSPVYLLRGCLWQFQWWKVPCIVRGTEIVYCTVLLVRGDNDKGHESMITPSHVGLDGCSV